MADEEGGGGGGGGKKKLIIIIVAVVLLLVIAIVAVLLLTGGEEEEAEEEEIVEADGMVSDRHNQNLWIYTADCMPILFADKRKRLVAAIHCGRKGLANKII